MLLKKKGRKGNIFFMYLSIIKINSIQLYSRAFTGKYNKTTEAGLYTCVVCNETLFTSETKFDSGCGWPAFNDVIDQKKVKLTTDTSNGMLKKFQ